ncbi:DUF3019 domain-containing protein [Microbulbifer elongatus]|uniref:DUF3019 domain-containing protein n=1 Tax=Microbulbifer elongatus TaxID=86173 RepID=UPI001E5E6725|nr:DUF3019 domain-containing protein [Microbulbifer elongatus]
MAGRSVLTGMVLALGAKASAAVPSGSSAHAVEYFDVTPRNCIVKQGDTCRAKFVFSWGLSAPAEVCIWGAGKSDPLYCSEAVASGRVSLDMALEKNTRFELSVKQTPASVATASIKVLGIGRHVRLKRRHLWSFL